MDILQWSSDEYEQRVFSTYWNWCSKQTPYPSMVQQLLANSAINKWWDHNFANFETEFLTIAENTAKTNVQVLRQFYEATTGQIMVYFPSALIDDIKRNRDFSNSYIPNTIYHAN